MVTAPARISGPVNFHGVNRIAIPEGIVAWWRASAGDVHVAALATSYRSHDRQVPHHPGGLSRSTVAAGYHGLVGCGQGRMGQQQALEGGHRQRRAEQIALYLVTVLAS